MNEINTELKYKAVSLGLCNGWQKMWDKNKSGQELIDMYKKGIDFCFEHDYPSNEFIKQNFDQELRFKNNFYVEEEFNKHNPENSCVILGGNGKLSFDSFSTCDIYIKDESEVEITASGFAIIFVNVYGGKVAITQKGRASIHVYRHGDCQVICDGNVVVRG